LLYDAIEVQSFFRTKEVQKSFIVNLADVRDAKYAGGEDCVQAQLAEYKLTQQEV
jgi:hypothetical protein